MKRLITCSDGTWNKPGVKDGNKTVRTNVQKIFEAISKKSDDGIYQLKHYDEGVGAEGNFITRLLNGATGKGIDENIIDAYKFLVWNYEPGDEIYLFGFSRGAYTARSLAGLIRCCGILKNNDLNLIKKAYDTYRDRSGQYKPGSEPGNLFKQEFSYAVDNIKFIGVWDTVGSLGLPLNSLQFINKKKYAFHDTTLSSTVDFAYHALAIDEKRKNFVPTLWTQSKNIANRLSPQIMEQRWFAGVHSNIGGGYPDEQLSDIALQWMIGKAMVTGLAFDQPFITTQIKPDFLGKLYESYSSIYKLVPGVTRCINSGNDTNEVVDSSAVERFKTDTTYQPKNLNCCLNRNGNEKICSNCK